MGVKIREVYFKYTNKGNQSVEALENINMEIEENEFIAIVGPSGCGKSTLLKLLSGILSNQKGEIVINLSKEKITRGHSVISHVFQSPTLLPWRTVFENIQIPSELLDTKSNPQEIYKLLKLVDLEEFQDLYPHQLSGGMKSRVSLARALISSPRILLLDEPFGALDDFTADNLNIQLLKIWRDANLTSIIVTHNINQAVFLSDRVFIMSSRPGTIIQELKINLPRPRHLSILDNKNFFQTVKEVRRYLFKGVESKKEGRSR